MPRGSQRGRDCSSHSQRLFTIKRLEISDRKARAKNAVNIFESVKDIKGNSKTINLEVKDSHETQTKNPPKIKKITLFPNTYDFKRIRLLPENLAFAPIEITGNVTFEVGGWFIGCGEE